MTARIRLGDITLEIKRIKLITFNRSQIPHVLFIHFDDARIPKLIRVNSILDLEISSGN